MFGLKSQTRNWNSAIWNVFIFKWQMFKRLCLPQN